MNNSFRSFRRRSNKLNRVEISNHAAHYYDHLDYFKNQVNNIDIFLKDLKTNLRNNLIHKIKSKRSLRRTQNFYNNDYINNIYTSIHNINTIFNYCRIK